MAPPSRENAGFSARRYVHRLACGAVVSGQLLPASLDVHLVPALDVHLEPGFRLPDRRREIGQPFVLEARRRSNPALGRAWRW